MILHGEGGKKYAPTAFRYLGCTFEGENYGLSLHYQNLCIRRVCWCYIPMVVAKTSMELYQLTTIRFQNCILVGFKRGNLPLIEKMTSSIRWTIHGQWSEHKVVSTDWNLDKRLRSFSEILYLPGRIPKSEEYTYNKWCFGRDSQYKLHFHILS